VTLLSRCRRLLARPHLRLIALVGVIVPRRLRADWRQEWEAELQHREALLADWARLDWRTKLDLVRRSTSAFWDAIWLQTHRWEDAIIQDLRFGARMLRTNKGFTLVAVLTLALGIGANAAVFSVVNAVLLRSLPYREPDRLVLLETYWGQDESHSATGGDFLAWRDQANAFEGIAAFNFGHLPLSVSGEKEKVAVGSVSAEMFETLGVAPAIGRSFTTVEDAPGGPPVVILSDRLWRARFGEDPQVLGRTLTLGDQIRTVVGIMPPGFRFPGEAELWDPLGLNVAQELGGQEGSGVHVLGRLKPEVTMDGALQNLSDILARQKQAFPANYSDTHVNITRLTERLVGNSRRGLLVLFGAVLFVLLIACANVANLLLARAAARQKELAIRAAVGAGRFRLLRQLLTESLLLALLGGIAGLLAANWGVKALVALSPKEIARIDESRLDGRVLGFTCLVVVLVSLAAGIFPALAASKIDLNETLKAPSTGWRSSTGRGGARRMLPVLMIAELALALVLLVGAGLMIKSFLRLQAVPMGFNAESVLTLDLMPEFSDHKPGSPQYRAYYEEVLARVQALPGIQSACLTNTLPLAPPFIILRTENNPIEGRPPLKRGKQHELTFSHVSPDYFKTLGIALRDGRPFGAEDGYGAPPVAIINETLARRFLPGENPIGLRLGGRTTIVGLVTDTGHYGISKKANAEIYFPYLQNPLPEPDLNLKLAVRVAASQNNPTGVANLSASIRNQVLAVAPNEPVNQIRRLEGRLEQAFEGRRFQMLLLSVFAGLALVMATIGIYGVISYAVSRRTHEIGIRMALGARGADVLRLLIWQGIRLTLIGVTLGLAMAAALTRILQNMLFEVSASDPGTFALLALVLLGVALIASYLPARRAAKLDPLLALRNE
jgi:putative ABC transport system permease protein